ncbi:MAG: hypothetical protein EAZ09_23990 [Oscillatoriales cyanobacterium]|nr:MAG: hypothetical protein EAZ09_23990 [Oscillatoriales cyanobacterium]
MANSQFPIPNSQFPIPNSQFPIPNSQFPIPNSQLLFKAFRSQSKHLRANSYSNAPLPIKLQSAPVTSPA